MKLPPSNLICRFFLGAISLSKKEEKMNNTFIFTDISAGLITGHFRDPQILTFKT